MPSTRLRAPSPEVLARFAAIVGPGNAVTNAAAMVPYLVERRGLYRGSTPLVLRPATTEEVSAILKLASETGTAIVPQGGNTGLVGGQIPDRSGTEIVVSFGRLDRIRALDAEGATLTIEAGATLAAAQAAAASVGRLFPLSLASEASAEIGGILATNAGGTSVLAYGSARDLVLGIEVVLASGEVWNGLRTLRKDNTGYGLRHLFVGSEGTLGIITAAVLRLFPRPRGMAVAIAGLADAEASVAFLNALLARVGSDLTSFELVSAGAMEFALRHVPGAKAPLSQTYPWYVLAEISSGASAESARSLLAAGLDEARGTGTVAESALAGDAAESAAFWRLRRDLSDVQRLEGGSIKHDVAVPVARIAEFLAQADQAVRDLVPGCRPVPFGHVGDGNIHFNVSQPLGMDEREFLALWPRMNEIVHAIVAELGGSIAAEHGIGRLKRDLLPKVKDPVELAMMRTLKAALDPQGILNPGKVL